MPSPTAAQPLTPAASAAARRVELARGYLTASDVQTRLGISHDILVQWRKAGFLLAVWHAPERRYLYPPYQFVGAHLLEEIATLLAMHRAIGADRSGWSTVEWLLVPHVLIDDQRPAEILQSDPARVLSAAQIEFSELLRDDG